MSQQHLVCCSSDRDCRVCNGHTLTSFVLRTVRACVAFLLRVSVAVLLDLTELARPVETVAAHTHVRSGSIFSSVRAQQKLITYLFTPRPDYHHCPRTCFHVRAALIKCPAHATSLQGAVADALSSTNGAGLADAPAPPSSIIARA